MKFVVKPTGITDWFTFIISSPQGGGSGVAVRAGEANSTRGALKENDTPVW